MYDDIIHSQHIALKGEILRNVCIICCAGDGSTSWLSSLCVLGYLAGTMARTEAIRVGYLLPKDVKINI
jgi:hypothetical protein